MASYIDTALITYALKQSTITDIISKRMYMIRAPQGAIKPYVVQTIPVPSNESEIFTFARMGQPLVQWLCVSDALKTPQDAFLVAHALMDVFANFQGTMESVVIEIGWVRGPLEIPSSRPVEDVECIVEYDVHYHEP